MGVDLSVLISVIMSAATTITDSIGRRCCAMIVAVIALLLILAIFGGGGFAMNVLWYVLIAALVLWLLGFVLRSAGSGGGWYGGCPAGRSRRRCPAGLPPAGLVLPLRIASR